MFPINENEKFQFSKAVYYNFNPIPVKKPWRDATGGFGSFAPLQGWVRIYDSEGYYGETFCSLGIVNNILPLVLTGETKTYKEWYEYLYWKMRNFGFQSGQIVDVGHAGNYGKARRQAAAQIPWRDEGLGCSLQGRRLTAF